MRIELNKNTVEFTPEADYEKTMLEGLWRMLVDCSRFNQKLVPVGEYVPAKSNTAQFAVEGEKGEGNIRLFMWIKIQPVIVRHATSTSTSKPATASRHVAAN